MPTGRPSNLTPALQQKIARYLFLAFTDEQIATACGIGVRSLYRYRADGRLWQSIKRLELEREAQYREKIWNAKGFWQGAAWYLERKYPAQFAKPEILMAVNNNLSLGPTNIVVLGPKQAAELKERQSDIRSRTLQRFERLTGSSTQSDQLLLQPPARELPS